MVPNGPISDKSLKVITGQHSRKGNDTTSTVYYATYVKAHNYTLDGSVKKDIALIKLDRLVTMNNFTSPICLPTSIKENPNPGSNCWIAGWGETESNFFL